MILEDIIKTIREEGWLEDVYITLFYTYLKANLVAAKDY